MMITVRKPASLQTGLAGRAGAGARPATAMQSLLPASAKLVRKAAPRTAMAKRGLDIATDAALTAGMRRILAQYCAGKYCTDDYSTRTCQRHRKFFLEIGIDLRAPHTTPASLSVPKRPAVQRAKSVPNRNKEMKQVPVPESAPVCEPICRKSRCASNAIFRMRRARVQQRKTGGTVGLGAMARITR